MSAAKRGIHQGFTLIEVILVIVLVGILSAVLVVFIVSPFQAARDMERRANLVDAADLALNRMSREIRSALPNSVRVHNSGHIEFINTVTGGRYRRLPSPGGTEEIFVPSQTAGTFDIPGLLLDWENISESAPGGDCGVGTGHCLSIFNTGQSAAYDAYRGGNIAPLTAASANALSYDGSGFSGHSPRQRFFVFDSPVSYVCSAGALRRFANYGLGAGAPTFAAGSGTLVVDRVSGCSFTYTPGTASRRGVVSMRLDLEEEGEHVFLMVQAQVLNTP
jgi:MSHA biogenesis protein MshO